MNEEQAVRLANTLGISKDLVVREEYEMLILKSLFESEVGRAFVFKGGTALRLAYGSPRYSEDLDFSVVKSFSPAKLTSLFKQLTRQFDSLELVETVKKYYTFFALFKVKEKFLPQAFSIKFEASTRPAAWKKEKDYQLTVLASKVTNLTVLAQVASLEKTRQEKEAIRPPRIRDIFDLWFIGQKMGQQKTLDFQGFDRKLVLRDLNKFLPEKERKVIKKWLPER